MHGKSKKPHALLSVLYHLLEFLTEFVILCFQSAFLPLDRIRLVIYLIFKLLEIRQRLGECQLSWCRLVSVSICNTTQLLPLTQSVTSNVVFCFWKISNGTLYLWLSVNILCSGGFFLTTPCCCRCHFCMFSEDVFTYGILQWCAFISDLENAGFFPEHSASKLQQSH